MGIGFEIVRFHFQRPVDIVGGERVPGVERTTCQVRVVEDIERDTDRDALIWGGTRGHCTRPEQDRLLKRIALIIELQFQFQGTGLCIASALLTLATRCK